MRLGNVTSVIALSVLLGVPLSGIAGCSGGGSSSHPATNAIATAVQDLSGDPDGTTTVVSFASTRGLSTATAANFEADGGQTAQTVLVSGMDATITWDQRVTPSHHVRAVNLVGVDPAYHAVATSDAAAPTFTITAATQNPGLGGDTIQIAFSGPRVVASEANDPSNWALTTDGQALPLAGSTFLLDVPSQTLDVTLSANANLHADFAIAAVSLHSVADVALATTPVDGAATGDTTAPTLVSANQNLAQDEYGRVVDFTFDKAMDPVFSTGLSHFVVTLPDIATNVEQPSEDVLRVSFNAPIVPAIDSVSLQGLVDLHGNVFPDTLQAISQPSPVVNAFAGNVQAVSVENTGGDYVTATTTQALDPDSAQLAASWDLSVNGSPVDLALQTISYDLLTKTLRIDLAFDLLNGQSFTLQGVAARDVDGQVFALSQTQAVAGDATPPTVGTAVQNRTVDATGETVDVQMSEDVDTTTAEALTSWSSSGGQNLLSATLQTGGTVVRLVFDAPMIPGDATISAQNVQDLAGNVMVAAAGVGLTSTDTTAPSVTSYQINAIEGPDNDVVEFVFDDDLIPAEIQDVTKWNVESPVGVPRGTTGATVLFDANVRRARLKFLNGESFRRDDGFQVRITGVRDLGGNTLPATVHAGSVISESVPPTVHTVWRPTANTGDLEVRFSEPCDHLEDLYDSVTNPGGARYVLRDSGGTLRGYATAASSVGGGLGVRVSFGLVVAATDTIDVAGPTDLAGNPLFPVYALATVAEDTTAPSLATGLSTFTSVTGEDNDVLSVRFDRPMSPWSVTDHVHYTPTGPTTISKRTREVTFDGVDTVTIPLRTNASDYDLLTGSAYSLEVDGVQSAQGVLLVGPQTEPGIVASGDSTPPTVAAGGVRIDPSTANSLLVEFSEAVAPPSATNTANYDYDAGTAPTSAVLVNPRVVRLGFASAPLATHNLAFTVSDRAGNSSGALARTVAAADVTGPLVASVDGLIQPGWGNDEVHVTFDEPLNPASAVSPANYTVTSGGVARSLTGASFTYASTTHLVTIHLAGGQDLAAAGPLSVGVSGVLDVSGNAMTAPVQVPGATVGDTTAPAIASAFVNWRIDVSGKTVDVLFTEDVDATFAADTSHWVASGSASVASAVSRERNHYRVTLSSALAGAGTLQITGLPDLAGNVSGAISIAPLQ